MTTTINADNGVSSGSSGLKSSADASGVLALQTNGTTAVTVDASQNTTITSLTVSGGAGSVNSINTFGFKNRIINGGMVLDQRNAGASVTAVNNTYTLDRWLTEATQTSKFTIQQNAGSVTPPTGFINYLGCTSSSAYSVAATDFFGIEQRIEGLNMADLAWGTANAKTVTLSAWVRSSLTGTFGGSLLNSSNGLTYPFSYSIPVANTWTQISVTIAGPTTGTWLTTNGIGVKVLFSLGAGSTYSGTAGSWTTSLYTSATGATSVVGTNGATFYITGVQLEVGSQATSFDFRDYGRELLLCQRYYQLTPSIQCVTSYGAETTLTGAFSLWTVMRADPTVSLNGSPQLHKPGIAFYNIINVTNGPSASGGSYISFTISAGAGTGTSGQVISPLRLSAEL